MKEGTEEKDMMAVVQCRGFKKLLAMKDCNKEGCEFHVGIQEEPIIERGDDGVKREVGVNKFVRCGFPRLMKIVSVCEVK